MPSISACLQTALVLLSTTTTTTTSAAALPSLTSRDATPDIGGEIAAIASMAWGIQNHWKNPSSSNDNDKTNKDTSCALTDVKLPQPSAPMPVANGTLKYVALGRGVQNYTCASSDSTTKPVAVGALATLWDMSCPSSRFQPIINTLAPLGLVMPVPAQPDDGNGWMGLPLLGHHYFTPGSTPTFNLKTAGGDKGYVNLESAGKVAAPSLAPKGVDGLGAGAVDWLALRAKPGPQGAPGQPTFQNVFRVNTAGGSPPATCDGLQKAFSVQYAAEYWFYQ